jgi:hypothetical protein
MSETKIFNKNSSLDMYPLYDGIAMAYPMLGVGHVYSESDKRWYVNNSFGHRGKEFTKNTDTLVVGCSITYGIGLELEETWGHVVSDSLGFDYRVLAFPGGSISKIVRQTIEYIYLFGPPKRILALMPEPRRIDLFETSKLDSNLLLINANDFRSGLLHLDDLSYIDTSTKKYVGHVDYSSAASMAPLNYLEKICAILEIELCWTTWQESVNISDTYSKFPSYFYAQFDIGEVEKSFPDCPLHTRVGDNFDMASDRDHWGHHYHLHVAEKFLEQLTRLIETKNLW